MTTKDFDKLGNECIDHLTALNPKGGIKVFVRMAVEFGYKRAVRNLTIPRGRTSFTPDFIVNELEDCEHLDDAIMRFKEQIENNIQN